MNEFKITIDMLVDALNALTDDDFGAPCEDDEFGVYGTRYARSNERIENIDAMASALFIKADGRCNWDNIRQLRKYGFRVYAGEQDSFGWLSGCIELPLKSDEDDPCVVVYG